MSDSEYIDVGKVKVVSDGTTRNTRVYAEDGREFKGVTFVGWSIRAGENSRVVLEVDSIAMQIEGMEALIPLTDEALLEELRKRGYKVQAVLDDGDLTSELQSRNDEDQDQKLPVDS